MYQVQKLLSVEWDQKIIVHCETETNGKEVNMVYFNTVKKEPRSRCISRDLNRVHSEHKVVSLPLR